jgi:hypothetical protein
LGDKEGILTFSGEILFKNDCLEDRRGCYDSIKIELREVGCEDGRWMELA